MEKKYFGTDGIRAQAGEYPLVPEFLVKLGATIGEMINSNLLGEGYKKVLIGKDTRISCESIAQSLAGGLLSLGIDILYVGTISTPALAFLTKNLEVDIGIMISASHNPYQDNGIKIISHNGYKLPDEKEYQIEEMLSNSITQYSLTGKFSRIPQVIDTYIKYLKSITKEYSNIKKRELWIDCSNGSMSAFAKKAFQELGLSNVNIINDTPDGYNINKGCGSLYIEEFAKRIPEGTIGISFDGDGDRVLFINEKREVVNGDKLMALLAREMKEKKRLPHNKVVATIMSNMGLQEYLKKYQIEVETTKVGDRYVLERMLEKNYNLGGEQSGHIIILDRSTTGDGLITCVEILNILEEKNISLTEAIGEFFEYPQILVNVKVKEKVPFEHIPGFLQTLEKANHILEGKGRVNVRYSGTEKVARIMVEARDQHLLKEISEMIAQKIRTSLGE